MNEDGSADGVSVTSVEEAEGGEGRTVLADNLNQTPPEKKTEPIHLKTKPVPAIIMLLGGAVVTADVFIQQLEFKKSLLIILVSLVFFLLAGELVKLLLDRIELPDPEAVNADGNVIQKGKSGENGSEEVISEDSGE